MESDHDTTARMKRLMTTKLKEVTVLMPPRRSGSRSRFIKLQCPQKSAYAPPVAQSARKRLNRRRQPCRRRRRWLEARPSWEPAPFEQGSWTRYWNTHSSVKVRYNNFWPQGCKSTNPIFEGVTTTMCGHLTACQAVFSTNPDQPLHVFEVNDVCCRWRCAAK